MSDLINRLQESIADAAAYETCAVVPLPELRWAVDELTRLREENARLREDGERLDWLEANAISCVLGRVCGFAQIVVGRETIDAAMREAK